MRPENRRKWLHHPDVRSVIFICSGLMTLFLLQQPCLPQPTYRRRNGLFICKGKRWRKKAFAAVTKVFAWRDFRTIWSLANWSSENNRSGKAPSSQVPISWALFRCRSAAREAVLLRELRRSKTNNVVFVSTLNCTFFNERYNSQSCLSRTILSNTNWGTREKP